VQCARHGATGDAHIAVGDRTLSKSQTTEKPLLIPKDLVSFVGICPPLLPGEEEGDFYELFDMMAEEIGPTTKLEWFAVAGVVDLLWDIRRYRLWKGAILSICRRDAFVTALARTQPYYVPNGPAPKVSMTMQEAQQWRTNPAVRAALETRIAKAGYDDDALNAAAFLDAQVPLAAIERFLNSARGQLNATLKEIGVRREFADRARKAFDERVKLTVEVPKPKQIGPN
jgi:hypothetical protein